MTNLQDILNKYPGATAFNFGDSDEMNAKLIALVLAGEKTATCGAFAQYEADGEELPMVGRCDIILNPDGSPAAVIETVSVEVLRFDDITQDFALAEGENETYAGWRRDHIAFFNRNGGWSGDMYIVCERFRLIEDLSGVGAPFDPESAG